MIYKFNYTEGVIEFVKNRGRACVEADSPSEAIRKVRELYQHTRNEQAEGVGERQYLVHFMVSLDYRLSLLRQVEKSIRLLRDHDLYSVARYIDRYIVASIFKETGKPEWLAEIEDIKDEISSLRKAAVVAREIPNILRFVDWDICIHNYIELNTKRGHRSRVVRQPTIGTK